MYLIRSIVAHALLLCVCATALALADPAERLIGYLIGRLVRWIDTGDW